MKSHIHMLLFFPSDTSKFNIHKGVKLNECIVEKHRSRQSYPHEIRDQQAAFLQFSIPVF